MTNFGSSSWFSCGLNLVFPWLLFRRFIGIWKFRRTAGTLFLTFRLIHGTVFRLKLWKNPFNTPFFTEKFYFSVLFLTPVKMFVLVLHFGLKPSQTWWKFLVNRNFCSLHNYFYKFEVRTSVFVDKNVNILRKWLKLGEFSKFWSYFSASKFLPRFITVI